MHLWPLFLFTSAKTFWKAEFSPQFQRTRVFMSPMCEELVEGSGLCITAGPTGSTCGPKALPEWRGLCFLRMGYSEACSTQRGRGNDKNILCSPPPCTCPPTAVSLSTLWRLFSGRAGFLCDGVVKERRKRGMGQRGKDRHTERWIAMGWWSCARSVFSFLCVGGLEAPKISVTGQIFQHR